MTTDTDATSNATAQIIEHLRDIHVETERDDEIRKQLRRLLKVDQDGNLTANPVRFTAKLESHGILLIEPTGGGKTTAIAEVLKSFDVLGINAETGAPRVVQCSVENPATQKSVAIAILRKLGISRVSDREKAWSLFDMVRRRIEATGATVLCIDEAQELFLSKSAREIEDTVKNLKSLMQGSAPVILILSGTERLAEINSYDSQVDRRFTKIVPKDLVIGTDNDALDGIIRDYCERAGVTFNPEGAVVSRLIHASRNRFGRAIETTINAIEQALLDGDSILERQHFAEAWAMKETSPWDRNIFVAEAWRSIELDVQAKAFEAARSARQLRRLALG
jgi:hypothetical protein